MGETPPDKLQGWLEREEEEFGVTGAVSRTIDWNSARGMLLEELGYDPSDAQIQLMLDAGRYRYEELPMIGVRTELISYPWGTSLWYRDIVSGQRLSLESVEERLAGIGLG